MQLCHAFPAALGRGRRGEPNKADGRSSEQTKTSQKVSARTRGRGGHSGWGSLCRRNARCPNNSSLAALFQGFLGSKQQRLRRAFEGSPSPEFVADHYRPVRNRLTSRCYGRGPVRMRRWFRPDFIITLYPECCRQCGKMALVEREFYHAALRRMHSARPSSAGFTSRAIFTA